MGNNVNGGLIKKEPVEMCHKRIDLKEYGVRETEVTIVSDYRSVFIATNDAIFAYDSEIVHTLMRALETRDFLTEGHAERLQDIVTGLAGVISLPESKIADLRLLARFHDIGKVGIPDSILFKPGPLTAGEYTEMKRHSEIGHRIAVSSPDLSCIADWILKHHEWWNGEGYPLRIKGEEIPLECRILAIADAYDAMTSDRPYRNALPHEEVVVELKRCAGTQFDPRLVKIFLKFLAKTFL